MGYTRKALATRGRILDCAAELIFEKGFDQTKLSEVLNGSRVQKGNFYYYFASKDELGLAVVRERGGQVIHDWLASSIDASRDPLTNINALAHRISGEADQSKSWQNPVAHLILELGRADGEYRQAVIEVLDDVTAAFENEFARLKHQGRLSADQDPATLGAFVSHLLRGAVLHQYVTGNAELARRSLEVGLNCVARTVH